MPLLVTADGKIWDASSYRLHQYLGFNGSTQELLDYSVRNLGAAMVVAQSGSWRIRIRTDFLPQPTFESLVQLMIERAPHRIAIEPVTPGQNIVEFLANISDVIARLDQLRADPSSWPRGSRFVAQDLSISRLRASGRPTLTNALGIWRRNKGEISSEALSKLLADPIGAKWLLSRMTKDGTPVTETLPGYITFFGDCDLKDLIGKPIIDGPDKEYTAKAARGYQVAHFTNEPLLEVIDALVSPTSGPSTQIRYDRLLLPWKAKDGARFVSSTSFTRVARLTASFS